MEPKVIGKETEPIEIILFSGVIPDKFDKFEFLIRKLGKFLLSLLKEIKLGFEPVSKNTEIGCSLEFAFTTARTGMKLLL